MSASEKNPLHELDTVGVSATNSIGYVSTMLKNLTEGRVSVPLRSPVDSERLHATKTTEVLTPENDAGWMGTAFTSAGGDTPAQISFTSGTEGEPKAVLLSRGNLHDVVTRLIDVMQITEEIREYIGVPVYHSFGYARARTVLHVGGDAFIPAKGFDLSEIRKMLRSGEINATRQCRACGVSFSTVSKCSDQSSSQFAGSKSAASTCLAQKRPHCEVRCQALKSFSTTD